MKKSVVALTALLALGLAACTPTNTSDSSTPSSTDPGTSSPSSETSSKPSQEQNFTSMSISNKDELQATWYVEAEESRTLNLSIDPATNQINLINSGKLTATSSNPAVAVCTGLGVAGVGVGTATITVTLYNDNGTTLTDTVDVTVTNRPVTAVGPQVVTDIKAGTYTFGFLNRSTGKISFITGEMSGFYGECVGVDQYDKAAKIELAASGEGWTMKVVTEGLSSTGKYVAAAMNDGHDNFLYQADPFVWTYDAEKTIFHAVVDGKDLFIGGNGNYGTADAYEVTDENVAANWYMLPYTFVEGYEKVTAPESGKTYKFGADKTGDPNLASCITGDMSGYYMVTTTDPEIAMDVTATETDGKWTLKTAAGKYIAVSVSGTHYNAVYQDEPFNFTFDEELATFVADVTYDGAPTQAIIGLQGTYATIGAYNISELDSTFVSHLYNGYYIPTEEVVMTEGPIFTAPEDGVAMKFGAYNDSKANEGFWIFTGEMDGHYLGATKVTDKATFDKQADVTPHAVGDKWTLEVGTGKYLTASTSTGTDGKTHNNIGIGTDAYQWTYDAANETFTTVLNKTTYFIGGQKSYDTFSLSDIKYVSENLKASLCTWGKLDTTEPEEPTDTPIDLATATDRTIADLADKKDVDTASLYKVTGILEGLDHTDKYGNAYVTDPATGKSIALYGMTTENVYTMVDGAVHYENPETAVETLADVNNGEEVTVVVSPVDWSMSSSIKYYSVLTDHKASTATYSITVDEVEHGTVSVTPDTASTYGTEATITVTPDEGYTVDKVALTTAMGSSTLTAETDGTYKFNVTVVNKVTVTLRDASAAVTSIEITADTLGLGGYAAGTASASGVNFSYTELGDFGHGIQWRNKNGKNSALWNTTAMPAAIESIELHFNTSEKNNVNARLSVGFGTAEIAEDLSLDNVAFTADNPVITIDNTDAADATYFRINHGVTSGSFYIDTIVINLAA